MKNFDDASFEIILDVAGIGMGHDGAIVSFHRNYSEYIDFRRRLTQTTFADPARFESFLIESQRQSAPSQSHLLVPVQACSANLTKKEQWKINHHVSHTRVLFLLLLLSPCQYFWFFPFFSENAIKIEVSPFPIGEYSFSFCSFSLESSIFQDFL